MALGWSDGYERLHYLLEPAWVDAACTELSDDFLTAVEAATTFVDRPLYALMHESIYCQGRASRLGGAAGRGDPAGVRPDRPAAAAHRRDAAAGLVRGDRSVAPLAETAELLAAYDGWPALYDPDRLAASTVPVAAAVYHEDMYVDHALSMETAERIGNLRVWSTGALGHDGLRSDDRVLDRLLAMTA